MTTARSNSIYGTKHSLEWRRSGFRNFQWFRVAFICQHFDVSCVFTLTPFSMKDKGDLNLSEATAAHTITDFILLPSDKIPWITCMQSIILCVGNCLHRENILVGSGEHPLPLSCRFLEAAESTVWIVFFVCSALNNVLILCDRLIIMKSRAD